MGKRSEERPPASRVFGVRIPSRGVEVLQRSIADSGLSQSAYFKLALEGLCSPGGVEAAAHEHGRLLGRAQAAELFRRTAEQMISLSVRIEKMNQSDVEAFEISDDGDDD